MGFKDIWSRTNKWVREKASMESKYEPELDSGGLMNPEGESSESVDNVEAVSEVEVPEAVEQVEAAVESSSAVVVQKPETPVHSESFEKLERGFNQLVEQLKGINEHLDSQASQQIRLMERIEQLPELLENFPSIAEGQKQMTEQMFEHLKASVIKTDQFMDAVEKIPRETGKQTDALVSVNHQLAAAADADVQMAETFNRFHGTLDKLGECTIGNSEALAHMSKTFVTSDRYTKYLMSKQQRRFMWVFFTAMGVSLAVVIALGAIIIYLK